MDVFTVLAAVVALVAGLCAFLLFNDPRDLFEAASRRQLRRR